ncbi:MAG: hypothetical protein KJ879_01220 [Nanoarchaeota archaeon]|nr:hypothetical protein [Nanoarchaeota archaeon]
MVSGRRVRTADQILAWAKKNKVGKRDPRYSDNKAYLGSVDINRGLAVKLFGMVNMLEFVILLEAGATPVSFNYKGGNTCYLHEAEYEDHLFMVASDEPFPELEEEYGDSHTARLTSSLSNPSKSR